MPERSCFVRALLTALLLTAGQGCLCPAVKPLPSGLACRGLFHPAPDALFLRDRTGLDTAGDRVVEQQIFDCALALIRDAEQLVVADLFLFQPFDGTGPAPHRPLCEELTAALIRRKREVPSLRAILITDPVNTVYGGRNAPHLCRLRNAGVEVVITDLTRLRDSNPLWSGLWHPLIRPWGNRADAGWMPNPFGAGRVTLRSWLALLNFKANHRKVVIADSGGELRALVTSANPHDSSSAHTNVGLLFSGPAAHDALACEAAVLAFSGGAAAPEFSSGGKPAVVESPAWVAVVTEDAVAEAAEELIGGAGCGDMLDLVMFYLADRRIVHALLAAARRGVTVRVLLDPNRDAFGRQKNGMPNRQTARELVRAGVQVRWAETRGEQMHAKLLLRRSVSDTADLLLGSANFTRRNLRGYNLETDAWLSGSPDAPALAAATAFVETLWENRGGRRFSTGYDAFRDDSRLRAILARIQEATGLCTW
jgi:hypothetical protein